MKLEMLIKELEKAWGLEQPLSQSGSGAYIIPLDVHLPLSVSQLSSGQIVLSSPFAKVPEKDVEKAYETLLNGNLFGQATNGALLGMSADCEWLTLTKEIGYDIDFKEFKDCVEDFINTVEFWQEETAQYR